jgi:hypothetical protein
MIKGYGIMKTDSLDPIFRLKISELIMGAEIATGLDLRIT